MNSVEPIALKYNSAVSTAGSPSVIIMWPLMWSVDKIIAVAVAFFKSLDSVPLDSFKQRLSDEGRNSFNLPVPILHKDVDPDSLVIYTIS